MKRDSASVKRRQESFGRLRVSTRRGASALRAQRARGASRLDSPRWSTSAQTAQLAQLDWTNPRDFVKVMSGCQPVWLAPWLWMKPCTGAREGERRGVPGSGDDVSNDRLINHSSSKFNQRKGARKLEDRLLERNNHLFCLEKRGALTDLCTGNALTFCPINDVKRLLHIHMIDH